jgi:8-oxo-dGTP diphosphatase
MKTRTAGGRVADDGLEFGARVPGAAYRDRPGAYVIVQGPTGDVAVVATDGGLFLPGGGLDAGETMEEAAIREVDEECGFGIQLLAGVGTADELVFAAAKGMHFRKRCSFFTARLLSQGGPHEADHEVVWMAPADAVARLTHASQRWAVAVAYGLEPEG